MASKYYISRKSYLSGVRFTYKLQEAQKRASAVNPAEITDQIRSGSLTFYNDERGSVSRQPSREIRSNRVGYTYLLQRPKKTASAVNPAERSDQIETGTLTFNKDQKRQRQPSIQQKDQNKSG